MLLTLDGTLAAVFPDLMSMIEPPAGSGILSTELVEGRREALVAAPCHSGRRRLRGRSGLV